MVPRPYIECIGRGKSNQQRPTRVARPAENQATPTTLTLTTTPRSPNPDPNPDLPLSTHPNHQRHFIFVLCNFSRLSLLLCLRHVITAVEWAACISINGIDVCDRSSVLWANSWGKRSKTESTGIRELQSSFGASRTSELLRHPQNYNYFHLQQFENT
ncbi:uncharacterized protein YALI1_F16249g [Yarrowia lipolytica]|uniref:Uncharacterized protein n=1 Tax=Yarrowia lipolytica TaxID=4952 RepID=A0A1D8NN54_YARLL|nr:hypothetical protein YALI1_F16249g [Yarrowia lipolytica]